MKPVIDYLLQFGQLNQQQIALIESKFTRHELAKDQYYHEAGKVPREIIFLTEGIMRIAYYNNKGNEITKYFMDENRFLADIDSFNQGIPTSEYIQAATDCVYYAISKQGMKDLSLTIIGWDEIVSRMIAKGMAEKVDRISSMMAEDATERYLNFLQKFPNLANRVSLVHLASYLGITPSSLSRIRKKISH